MSEFLKRIFIIKYFPWNLNSTEEKFIAGSSNYTYLETCWPTSSHSEGLMDDNRYILGPHLKVLAFVCILLSGGFVKLCYTSHAVQEMVHHYQHNAMGRQ